MAQRNPQFDSAPETGEPSDDPRLWEVVKTYEEELRAGRQPDRAAYVNRYPELASAVAECLDGLQFLHGGSSGNSARISLPKDAFIDAQVRPAPLGDFQIVGEIARGGMGIVYEAIQLSLGRRVALKVLPIAATVDPRQLQRFKIEAQAAALLHHTHIVPIYAVGCERGVHYYAMQLIEGQSLAAVLHSLRETHGRHRESAGTSLGRSAAAVPSDTHDPRLTDAPFAKSSTLSTENVSAAVTAGNALSSEGYLRRAAQLIIQAAEALEHAHQSGVVHRDIKPANLLIDRAGKLWVTDFGLAQLQSENGVTRSSDMLGTFRYMSPEQTGGQRVVLDHRTDIYSLGATLYELVTLEPAFSASSHHELLFQILHTEPRRPRELNHAIPPELETIILKSLSKAPGERYATAGEFAADLQRFLEHRPILARPPSLLDRTRKWVRRNPAIVAAAVIVLAVITIGSLIANWMISREQSKTADALRGQKLRTQEAEDRFAQTRAAVDTLFQISEEEFADRPWESARQRILEVVLTHYEEFIAQRSGDAASQAELAEVQDKVKAILRDLATLRRAMDLRLLQHPAVQTELQLTTAQQQQLSQDWLNWADQEQQLRQQLQQASEAQRRSQMADFAEQQQHEVEQVLTDQQLDRFRQIAVQARGLFAFKDPDIVRALELTSEQRAKIRDLEREMFAEIFPPGGPMVRVNRADEPKRGPADHDHPKPPDGDWHAGHRPDRLQMLIRRTEPKVWINRALALLTLPQRAQWQELTGDPFTDLFEVPGLPRPPR